MACVTGIGKLAREYVRWKRIASCEGSDKPVTQRCREAGVPFMRDS